VSVDLFIDGNGNGVFDTGETLFATTVTDGNGDYSFTNVPDGTQFATPSDDDLYQDLAATYVEDEIYMLVEDLKYFGYDIQQHPYVAKISIQARTNNMSPITNASGPLMGQYVDSNYKVTFNNQLLDCYDIDGKPAFKVTYLTSVNATITWDGTNRELLINFPN